MQHVSVVSGSYVDSLSYIKARCRITIDLKKIWSVFSHWIKAPITEKGNVSTLPKLCQENGQHQKGWVWTLNRHKTDYILLMSSDQTKEYNKTTLQAHEKLS